MAGHGHRFKRNVLRDNTRAHFGDSYTYQTCLRQATFSERSSRKLLQAAKEGQRARVKAFLEQKADPDFPDEDGTTSLHHAVLRSSNSMVEDLRDAGADLNAESEKDGTPLLLAVLQGSLGIVKLLAQSDVVITELLALSDVVKPLDRLGTALHAAAYVGDEKILAALGSGYITLNCSLAATIDLAAYNGLVRKRTKIKKGLHAVILEGITPFSLAARTGSLQVLRHLIALSNQRCRSDLSTRSSQSRHGHAHGLSRVASGVVVNPPHVVKEKDCAGRTALMFAAQQAHKTCVEFLCDEGSVLNTSTSSGDTALSLALKGVTDMHCEVATLLIEKGACCEWRNDQGNTLLHLAAANGHEHALAELIQKHTERPALGTNVVQKPSRRPGRNCNPTIDAGGIDSINLEGQTALSLAVKQENEECAYSLIAAGASVNLATENEWPPIVHAAARGHLAILQQLLDKNADILARTPGGATALHKASENGHTSILNCLLKTDALIPQLLAATDNARQTALHVAALHHQTAAVDILRQAGAHAGLKDRDGNTAWEIAGSHSDDDVRAVLKKHREREAREHYERSVAFPKRPTPVRRLRWSSLFSYQSRS